MNIKLEVIQINEDVIATSGIDHTLYDHFQVESVDAEGTNYEQGYQYKWNENKSKLYVEKYFRYWDNINIPNAVKGKKYINVNGTWIECNEKHTYSGID